jgi:hypothetical protein
VARDRAGSTDRDPVTPDPTVVRRRQERIAAVASALTESAGLSVTPAIGQDPTFPDSLPGLHVIAEGTPVQIRIAAVEIERDLSGISDLFGGFRRAVPTGQPGFVVAAHDLSSPNLGHGPASASQTRYVGSVDEAIHLVRAWLADAVERRVEPPQPDPRARARWLAKVGAAMRADAARSQLRVDPAIERSNPGLAGRISARAIAWHLPRRPTAKLDPQAVIALVPLGDPARRVGTREDWIVARPDDDPDRMLTLDIHVEGLISENEDHRWDGAPWRWDSTATAAEPARRWDGDPAALEPILAALDEGRWDDALRLADVRIDEALRRVLAGRDASYDTRDLTAAWAPRLAEAIGGIALWRLADATTLLRKGHPTRLFGLGGVNIQRKPGVFLGIDEGRPRLELEWSASNERLPWPAWTRPVDLDLVRAGIIGIEAIPT